MSIGRPTFMFTFWGVVSAIPLLVVVLWAYSPAKPYDYPGIHELLLNAYYSPAAPASFDSMRLRAIGLALLTCLAFVLQIPKVRTFSAAGLAGVMFSLPLTLPLLVPFVLQAEGLGALALWFGILSLSVVFFRWLIACLPAVAAPLAAVLFLSGVVMSVYSSAEVMLRSNPPLFVLAQAARNPNEPVVRLALGMHLLSIGGGKEAEPILRSVGKELSEDFLASENYELLSAAERVAEWSYEALNESVDSNSNTQGE